jgi:hypothetical protein
MTPTTHRGTRHFLCRPPHNNDRPNTGAWRAVIDLKPERVTPFSTSTFANAIEDGIVREAGVWTLVCVPANPALSTEAVQFTVTEVPPTPQPPRYVAEGLPTPGR